ncbi:MAG TPA: hypothetical protein VNT58_09880 [Gaiellaceae bacterium]|nr:hypothetical protein [Gaiellaceae bacterium]
MTEAANGNGGKGDALVEKGAEKLERLSRKAAAKGGLAGKLAGELAEDASFLRRLKPSLMAARAKGELPKDAPPGSTPRAPSGPQLGARRAPNAPRKGGRPFVVVGAAFAAGIALAKAIDWRGHAHPRR